MHCSFSLCINPWINICRLWYRKDTIQNHHVKTDVRLTVLLTHWPMVDVDIWKRMTLTLAFIFSDKEIKRRRPLTFDLNQFNQRNECKYLCIIVYSIACILLCNRKIPSKSKCHRTLQHYSDVIMGTMASQIVSVSIACSAFYSGADQWKHQSSASLAFHRWPVNSPRKEPETRKMFPFDDVISMDPHNASWCLVGRDENKITPKVSLITPYLWWNGISVPVLTYWARVIMAAILQTTFFNSFSPIQLLCDFSEICTQWFNWK